MSRPGWIVTTGWHEGRCYSGEAEYPVLDPPRKPPRERKPPRLEPDVEHGPFLIRCMYGTSPRPFSPLVKRGYMLIHPDTGARWADRLYRTPGGARELAALVAAEFNVTPWYAPAEVAA